MQVTFVETFPNIEPTKDGYFFQEEEEEEEDINEKRIKQASLLGK